MQSQRVSHGPSAAAVQPIDADELHVRARDILVSYARGEARAAEQQQLRRLVDALAWQQAAQVLKSSELVQADRGGGRLGLPDRADMGQPGLGRRSRRYPAGGRVRALGRRSRSAGPRSPRRRGSPRRRTAGTTAWPGPRSGGRRPFPRRRSRCAAIPGPRGLPPAPASYRAVISWCSRTMGSAILKTVRLPRSASSRCSISPISCNPVTGCASAPDGRARAAATSERRLAPALMAARTDAYEVGSAMDGSSRSSSVPSRNIALAGLSSRRSTQRSKSFRSRGPDPPHMSL